MKIIQQNSSLYKEGTKTLVIDLKNVLVRSFSQEGITFREHTVSFLNATAKRFELVFFSSTSKAEGASILDMLTTQGFNPEKRLYILLSKRECP